MPASSSDILADLNPRQREAVEHMDGPLLVVAGAGSGKTRVLTYRIANILATQRAWPREILAITFTNRAAAEMRERVASLVGDEARSMWVMTFHAACGRILRREAEQIGYTSNFTIYDQGDQVRLVKQCVEALDLDAKRFVPNLVHSQISNAKNALVTPDEYAARVSNFFEESVAEIYRAYNTRLRANNAMDFDDMLVHTVALFESSDEARERWQQRFKYVLVDEYQDTNHAQYRLLRSLVASHQNVCCVGDEDQSVYSWRGADIRNILDFEQDFPSAHTVVLDQNYRSTQHILDAANAVVANNTGRNEKHLWSDLGEGERVRVIEADDEHAEARYIAGQIEAALADGHSARDVAVFYRTNAQSRVLEDILTRQAVPYQVIGGPKFYERAEIKDAVAYLRVLVNPHDSLSLARIVNTPKRGIGNTTVARAQSYAATLGDTLYSVLAQPEQSGVNAGAAKKLRAFGELLESLIAEVEPAAAVAPLIELVYERTGLVRALQAEDTIEAQGRIENLGELVSVAAEYDARAAQPSLGEFLEAISLAADADSIDREGGAVTLMTMHNAKGLEYPIVFVGGMEEGLFPHSRSVQEQNIEEERRLCYVVITRAREQLTLLHATSRTVFGRRSYNTPSRFLDELPAGAIERSRRNPASWSGGGASVYGGPQPGGLGWAGGASSSGNGWGGGGTGSGSAYGSWGSSQPQKRAASQIPQLEIGANVRHATFGDGVVTNIERGELVVVRFADSGEERRLMLAYAPLERI